MPPFTRFALCLIAGSLVVAPSLLLADESPGLNISVPVGWKVNRSSSAFYSVKKEGEDFGELMIVMAAPMEDKAQLRAELDRRVTRFVSDLKNATDWKTELDNDKYTLTEIDGEVFSGYYAKFGMPIEQVTAIFMISSNDQTWWIQYAGAASNWAEAVAIVKGLKKHQ